MIFGCASVEQWGRARRLLIPAIEWGGEYTEDQVRQQIADREAQLWIGEDSEIRCAVVTSIRTGRDGPICDIWLMGGNDRSLWLHFLAVIEAAAADRGCVAMELTGRTGWRRVLPDYREQAIVLRKAL